MDEQINNAINSIKTSTQKIWTLIVEKTKKLKTRDVLIAAALIVSLIAVFPASRRFAIENFEFYIMDPFHKTSDEAYFFNLGIKRAESKREFLAIRTFKRMTNKFNPNNPYQREALFNIGVLYYQLGQSTKDKKIMMKYFNQASKYLDIFLNFYPDAPDKKEQIITVKAYIDSIDEVPQNQLAKYYKDQGQKEYYNKNYDKALEFYFKAIGLDTTYDTVYNNIGSIYYFKNNYENAVKYWEQAVLLKPEDNKDLYLTIGSVYGQFLNNPERAIYFLKKHLEMNQHDNQKNEIENYIKQLETQLNKK